jgi:hypothetical protein
MPTFYKYAERQAGSQVDWAGLGVDAAETILETERIREQKRTDIDNATNKLVDQLANAPKGEEANGNKLVSDYSDNMTKALLIQHKLLKSGKLDPKAYMLYRANAETGTNQLFNLQKEYQNQFTVTMERMKKGESQDAETDLKAYYESFADLSKMNPVIDPMTGQVSLSIMEYDKNNILQPTGQVSTVQSAYKGLGQKFDKFNIEEATKTVSDRLAPVIKTIITEGTMSQSGRMTTIDDALQDANTVKAMENYAEAYLENPYNVSSILTNSLGTYQNDFSRDGSKKGDGSKLMWSVDNYGAWKPNPTEKQRKEAKDYLITQIKASVSQKEEIKTFQSQALDAYNARTARERVYKQNTGGGGSGADKTDKEIYDYWVATVGKDMPKTENGRWSNKTIEGQLNDSFSTAGFGFELSSDGKSMIVTDNNTVVKGQPVETIFPMGIGVQQDIQNYLIRSKSTGKGLKDLRTMYTTGSLNETDGSQAPSNTNGKKVITGF